MLPTPTNFKTKQGHPRWILHPAVKKLCRMINCEKSWFILWANIPQSGADQFIIQNQHCSACFIQSVLFLKTSVRVFMDICCALSLLSCNEDLCAGHVLLLQGYLFSYWLKIKMVIYASIPDRCNVLFHWFSGSSLHAFNSLCETLTARSFQTSHSQFCSLQLPTSPNH